MKNVIIFAVDGERFAVELRWVREVISLGHVTRIPGAPVHVAGAINVRGAITPVLDLGALPGEANRARHARARRATASGGSGDGDDTRPGDGAVLIDVEGVAMALRMSAVEEVSTVSESTSSAPGGVAGGVAGVVAGAVIDSRGREVALIEPPELVRLTLALAHSKRELPALPVEPDTMPVAPAWRDGRVT